MVERTMQPITPIWLWGMAGLGAAWNAYGIAQFLQSVTAERGALLAKGLSAAQATVMLGLPVWMTLAFAIGVFGGFAGCALLLARHRSAVAVLALSLAGYVVLYAGDITEGVFTAMGMAQIIILSAVVLIAAGLMWLARHAQKSGLLR